MLERRRWLVFSGRNLQPHLSQGSLCLVRTAALHCKTRRKVLNEGLDLLPVVATHDHTKTRQPGSTIRFSCSGGLQHAHYDLLPNDKRGTDPQNQCVPSPGDMRTQLSSSGTSNRNAGRCVM